MKNMNQKQYTIHVGKIPSSSSDNGELAVDVECHKTKTRRGAIDVIIIVHPSFGFTGTVLRAKAVT
jgi:hypothetical protein